MKNTVEVTHQLAERTELKRYQQRMDSALAAKVAIVESHLAPNQTIVSVGAGTGKLERYLAEQGAQVMAVDLSLPMLDSIQGQAEQLEHEQGEGTAEGEGRLWPVYADAFNLPIGEESVDLIICSSVLHEVCSFGCGYDREKLRAIFRTFAMKLKPGGKLIIKDFVQPANPEQQVQVRIGEALSQSEVSPQNFLEQFSREFKGDDFALVRQQIFYHVLNNTWGSGAVLTMSNAQAMELIAHYSWHSSPEEIKEKYAYWPLEEYAQVIQEEMLAAGVSTQISELSAVAQPGYDEHTQGRFDIIDSTGNRQALPAWTGTIVIQRVNS